MFKNIPIREDTAKIILKATTEKNGNMNVQGTKFLHLATY